MTLSMISALDEALIRPVVAFSDDEDEFEDDTDEDDLDDDEESLDGFEIEGDGDGDAQDE